jgi:hypothetical protein
MLSDSNLRQLHLTFLRPTARIFEQVVGVGESSVLRRKCSLHACLEKQSSRCFHMSFNIIHCPIETLPRLVVKSHYTTQGEDRRHCSVSIDSNSYISGPLCHRYPHISFLCHVHIMGYWRAPLPCICCVNFAWATVLLHLNLDFNFSHLHQHLELADPM